MWESSRSRVTITLGRAGQVVKMGEYDLDDSFPDAHLVRKRPVRERLGEYVESYEQNGYKRFRGDPRNVYAADEDFHLSKDDLRHKIMQKNGLKHRYSQPKDDDLRNVLSRPASYSKNSIGMHEAVPGSRNTRMEFFESKDYIDRHKDIRDGRHFPPFSRHSSQLIPHSWEERRHDAREIVETREGRRGFLDVKEVRYRASRSLGPSLSPDIPGMRGSDDMLQGESRTNLYSPWNLDQLRKRSPDETFVAPKRDVTQRKFPPSYADTNLSRNGDAFEVSPKRDESTQRRYPLSYNGTTFPTRKDDATEVSRPKILPYAANISPPIVKTTSSQPSLPQSGVGQQRNSEPVDVQDPVESFLRSVGLERFAVQFKAEEVDMYSLKRMSESDLAELDIPMGPRRQILFALRSLHASP